VTQHPPETGVPTCYRHPGRETYIRCQRCDRPICPDCMREASVGFQCPECVAQGHRDSRQPRRVSTGGFAGELALAPATWVILAINVVIFLLVNVVKNTALLDDLMIHARSICDMPGGFYFAGMPHAQCTAQGGSYSPGVVDGAWWQLITNTFTQQAIWHIGTNMLSLVIMGRQLEGHLGTRRFVPLYLLAALGGSTLVYWTADQYTPTLGASGALFGLMAAYVVIFLRARASLQPLLLPLVLNFGITFAVPNISWQGHVGGFIVGGLVMILFTYTQGVRRRPLQWLGMAAFLVVLLALVAARSAALS
jgi:membrane associated rhomboid family serine protease